MEQQAESHTSLSHPGPHHTRIIFPIGWVIILLLLGFFLRPAPISNGHTPLSQAPYSELSVIFTGDVMQHMPQVESAWNDSLSKYIYDSCFRYVKPILSSYDLAVGNLETTLAGKPYSGYPAFSSPYELVNGLKNAGFDLLGTANNHCCDRGYKGVVRTVNMLDSLEMPHMGTYRNSEDFRLRSPYLFRKNGISLALLNYTYGTNGIPVPEGTVVNLIEKDKIRKDLESAKALQPDKVIIFIHWGVEYQREPNDFQKDIATFCFDNGADVIIGSHPHVIQPMEWWPADSLQKEKLVVWSLGNYVSNQRNRFTDGGVMVGITFRKEFGVTKIHSADYRLSWVWNPVQYGKRQYYILPVKDFEQDSALMNQEDFAAFTRFAADSRELLSKNRNIPEN